MCVCVYVVCVCACTYVCLCKNACTYVWMQVHAHARTTVHVCNKTMTTLTGKKSQHRNGHGNGGRDFGKGDKYGRQHSRHLVLHLQRTDPQGGDAYLGHSRHQAKLKTLHHLVLHTSSQRQELNQSISVCSTWEFHRKAPWMGKHELMVYLPKEKKRTGGGGWVGGE